MADHPTDVPASSHSPDMRLTAMEGGWTVHIDRVQTEKGPFKEPRQIVATSKSKVMSLVRTWLDGPAKKKSKVKK